MTAKPPPSGNRPRTRRARGTLVTPPSKLARWTLVTGRNRPRARRARGTLVTGRNRPRARRARGALVTGRNRPPARLARKPPPNETGAGDARDTPEQTGVVDAGDARDRPKPPPRARLAARLARWALVTGGNRPRARLARATLMRGRNRPRARRARATLVTGRNRPRARHARDKRKPPPSETGAGPPE